MILTLNVNEENLQLVDMQQHRLYQLHFWQHMCTYPAIIQKYRKYLLFSVDSLCTWIKFINEFESFMNS